MTCPICNEPILAGEPVVTNMIDGAKAHTECILESAGFTDPTDGSIIDPEEWK